MQYNGETNHQDIVTFSNQLVKQTDTSFPIVLKTMFANMIMRIIWSVIFQVYGGWHFDDSNYTTLPSATHALVSGQAQYTFPVGAAHVMGVSVKDSSGSWHQLRAVTLEQIQERGAESEYQKTPGNPGEYRLTANGLVLYSPANYDLDGALRIYISRDIVSFTVTSTIQEPGFEVQFHEAVPVGMAMKFAQINSLPQAGGVMRGGFKTGLASDFEGYIDRIKKYYGNRFRQQFPQRIRQYDNSEEYI